MKSIILEVRDKGTLIPVMATMLSNNSGEEECEDKLLSRAGYGEYGSCLLTMLESGKSTNDPFKWDEYCRTMNEAHIYIQKHFIVLSIYPHTFLPKFVPIGKWNLSDQCNYLSTIAFAKE